MNNRLKRLLKSEVVRFLIVGALATLIDLLVRLIFNSILINRVEEEINIIVSFSFGFTISLLFNYVLSTLWVYKGKRKLTDKKAILLFLLTSIFSYLVGLGAFYLLSFLFSLININITVFSLFDFFSNFTNPSFYSYVFSFFIQSILNMLLNYILRKKVVYK